jgi:hypothetical protein
MHLGLIKLQERDKGNAAKLKKTEFSSKFKRLKEKLQRENTD